MRRGTSFTFVSEKMDLLESTDESFVVPGGKLLKNSNRYHAFPSIYQVDEHPLVTDTTTIRTILVTIVDTSKEAQKIQYEMERTLSIPLGPDSLMESRGTINNLIQFLYMAWDSYINNRFVRIRTRNYRICSTTWKNKCHG